MKNSNLPPASDDTPHDESQREQAFQHMIDQGLEDVRLGQVISNAEMLKRVQALSRTVE